MVNLLSSPSVTLVWHSESVYQPGLSLFIIIITVYFFVPIEETSYIAL